MNGRARVISWRIAGGLVVGVGVMAGIAGCPEPPRPPPAPPLDEPEPVSAVIAHVNANADRMPPDVLLFSRVDIQAGWFDDDGEEHRLDGGGDLKFVKPRKLLLVIKHDLGGRLAEVGSDGERYWLWYEKDKTLWWCKHEHLDKPRFRDMPIRPDQLIVALGLTRLPSGSGPLWGPWYRATGGRIPHTLNPACRLGYFSRSPDGAVRLDRDYYVSQVSPFLAERIEFRDKFGALACEATLAHLDETGIKNDAIEGPAPFMPYEIWLRLSARRSFLSVKLKAPRIQALPPLIRKRGWWKMAPPAGTEIIQIDKEYDQPTSQPT